MATTLPALPHIVSLAARLNHGRRRRIAAPLATALFACLVLSPSAAQAASVVMGQHFEARIEGLPDPTPTSMYVRDLAPAPLVRRAVDSDQSTALQPSLPMLDAEHGRLFVLVQDKASVSLWRITHAPLAIQAKTPFACGPDEDPALLFPTADGKSLLALCRDRLVAVGAETGAELASTIVPAPGGGYPSIFTVAYDDFANILYLDVISVSGFSVLAYDASTLHLIRTYGGLPAVDSMFVDDSGYVMFTAIPDGASTYALYRLDPKSGAFGVFDAFAGVQRFDAPNGRTSRIVAVEQRLGSCGTEACDDPVLVEYDVKARRSWTTVLDDRGPMDPTRPNLTVGVDFMAPVARAREAVEYVRGDIDHYFITADATEIAALDAGAFEGSARTGETFPVFANASDAADPTSPVCRFYGRPEYGLDTHFYSALPQECAAMKPLFGDAWVQETLDAFDVYPVAGDGTCPHATTPVYRLFNNRSDANHRYTTSRDVRASMIGKGWMPEGLGVDGVGFCVPRR